MAALFLRGWLNFFVKSASYAGAAETLPNIGPLGGPDSSPVAGTANRLMHKIRIQTLADMRNKGERISCLTAYDYSFARILDRAGVDTVLVGDSLGNVIQGEDSTLPVTLEQMIYHSRCVAKGLRRALLIVDMPFLSYQSSPRQALENAGRLMKEGSAEMVKLEGGEAMAPTVRFLVERGIPVCGHLGLTPQSVHQLGGYRVQGREQRGAERLKTDARLLAEAGASLLVLEAIPSGLAEEVTRSAGIPTIGIGAGAGCDGQVLVLQDMLGLTDPDRPLPKFVRNFLIGHDSVHDAVVGYVRAVKSGEFPTSEHSYR